MHGNLAGFDMTVRSQGTLLSCWAVPSMMLERFLYRQVRECSDSISTTTELVFPSSIKYDVETHKSFHEANINNSREIWIKVQLTIMAQDIKAVLTDSSLDFHNRRTNYSTHGLHPYGAKFPPQLPKWMIKHLSKPGELIVDPFSGGGTTLVEGRLLNRNVAGGDVDPLAERVSLAKSIPLDIAELEKVSQALEQRLQASKVFLDNTYTDWEHAEAPPPELRVNGYNIQVPDFPRRDYWFHPRVSVELALISHLVSQINNPDLRRFLEVVLSSCIIAKTSPVANIVDLVHTRPHYQPKDSVPSAIDIFLNRMSSAQRRMEEFVKHIDLNAETWWVGNDIRSGLKLEDESAHLIMTSPPYINALDYPRAHRFALYWLGLSHEQYHEITYDHIGLQRVPVQRWQEMENEFIGVQELDDYILWIAKDDIKTASLLKRYLLDLRCSFVELRRILIRERYAIVVIGASTMNRYRIDTPDLARRLAVDVGLKHVHTIFRKLDSGKRYLPFRSSGIMGGIREEAVIVLQKV